MTMRIAPQTSRLLTAMLALAVVSAAGCTGGTLGGRDKCWAETSQLVASLWRGVLQIDVNGHVLNTAEGDVITLLPGTLVMRINDAGGGELVAGEQVLARTGDEVTLFGGIAADGTFLVCGLEEVHAQS